MKLLSPNQWALLESANNKDGAGLVDNNILTISALYTRNLVKFVGAHGSRRIVPTPLGKMYLKNRQQFGLLPDYKESLKLAKREREQLQAKVKSRRSRKWAS